MISTYSLINLLGRVNSMFNLRFTQSSKHDILPAALHYGDKYVCAIPKGWIYEHTTHNEDGSIRDRGFRDILKMIKARVGIRIKTL